jgi:hypothetical protein
MSFRENSGDSGDEMAKKTPAFDIMFFINLK